MIDLISWYIEPLTYRSFLVTSILVLISVTLVLFVTMLVHKIYVELREARSAQMRNRYGAIFTEFLERHTQLIEPDSPLAVDALADVAINRLQDLDLYIAQQVRTELKRVGIIDDLACRLRSSRSWVRRHRALERLGFMKLPDLRPVYLEIIAADKDSRIVSKALWALSYVAEESDLPVIVRTIGDSHLMSAKFNEYLFTNIIAGFRERHGDDAAVAILKRTLADEQLPVLLKRDIIEACGRIGFTAGTPVIVDTFHRYANRPEIRITVLRALGALSSDAICDFLLQSLGDEDWRVRLVASQYAHLCSERSILKLESLLRDSNYHVRLNAAHTLAKLGESGTAALVRSAECDDRFARDVSRYLLREHGNA